jgi:hypothetical protein
MRKSYMAPKVFISHASEDKARFVGAFALRLRERGVDAWLDKWEIQAGDSLVDKIFEEGLKQAAAVIVVLSKFSVDKPWVREELNAAFVKRINGGSKLIPVVLDDCEVPEALKTTKWEVIRDLDSYDDSFESVIASIFGLNRAPPIGPAPSYAQFAASQIGGLSPIDSQVFEIACKFTIDSGDNFVDPALAFQSNSSNALSASQLQESFEALEQAYFIRISHTIGKQLDCFTITTTGFDAYATSCVPDYSQIVVDVITCLVNKGIFVNLGIAEHIRQPRLIVDHVLDVLEQSGHIKCSKSIGYHTSVYHVAVSLKRSLQ